MCNASSTLVTTDPRYWNQIGPFGGWLAAQALRVAREQMQAEFQPRSFTMSFMGRIQAGDIQLEVHEVAATSSLRFLSVRLSQGQAIVATAEIVFGRSRTDWSLSIGTFPDASPPERYERWRALEPLARFTHEFDYRLVQGEPGSGVAPHQGATELVGYVRSLETGLAGPERLLMLADAWFPASWIALPKPLPVTTITMNVVFHAGDQLRDSDEFLLSRLTTLRIADGYAEELGQFWSSAGTLVMSCQQLTWIDSRALAAG